jgi:hypothetical protein
MSVLAGRRRYFFNLRGVSILNQLCFEELLLRTTEANWLALHFRTLPSGSTSAASSRLSVADDSVSIFVLHTLVWS